MISQCISATARRRRPQQWIHPFSTLTSRSFATSRQKRAAAAKEKEKQPTSNGASSIIGMRPGQTPFSPPQQKNESSIHPPKLNSTSGTSSNSLEKNYMQNSNIKRSTPLILPPTASQISALDETRKDNSSLAHSQPYDSMLDKSENPMRDLFLQQGILPSPPRPDTSSNAHGKDSPAQPVEIPEAGKQSAFSSKYPTDFNYLF
jgi:hypothetical protein